MANLFHTFLVTPLFNGFVFLIDVLPWLDAGVIIVIFTILVKFILYPLSKKAVIAQIEMKSIEKDLKNIKEKYKDDKQEQAKKTMELYKEKNINPFSSIFIILIQLPIIFALYYVFLKSGLPEINTSMLYSFVSKPDFVDMNFLGLVNITGKSLVLAFLAGASSFFQIRMSVPAHQGSNKGSFQDDLARSMNIQMRYVFPVIVFFISYQISGVVALYWFTSNIFTLLQERSLRKMRAAA